MSKPRLSGIAPPPSLDDILSADLDETRVGAVDFTTLLAPVEETSAEASEEQALPVKPVKPAAGQARADALSRARQRASAAREQAAAQVVEPEPVAPAPVVPEPEPVAVEPEAELEPEPEVVAVEPRPEAELVEPEIEVPPVPVTQTVEPEIEVVPEDELELELEPEDEFQHVGHSVERVAESVITRMQAAGEAHLRHLEAIEVEAARRCELLTAQAELDAELIRLHARREAHAIIAAARLRTGAPAGETAASRQLHEIGETFSRFAEAIETTVAQPTVTPDYPPRP